MRSKLKILDLFSGIGGFSLGLELTGGFETAAFCEIEKYPQEVLRKNFPGVPIYDDIKTLTAERLVRDGIDRIDIITGGYPCQPFSVAGKQKGEQDDRHLWPSMLEIIAQVRPTWVICENVTGHIALGLDQVLLDLENEGYSTRTFIIPACSVNAPHRRDRLWIVAHSNDTRQPASERGRQNNRDKERNDIRGSGENVADSDNLRVEERHKECAKPDKQKQTNNAMPCSEDVADSESVRVEGSRPTREQKSSIPIEQKIFRCDSPRVSRNHWKIEPRMGRVADGIPRRVAKLKALGNAVVPQICMMIGRAILEFENENKN